jgi:hypothetical protein
MQFLSLPLHQKHFHFFHDFNSKASSRAETTIASLAKIPVGRTTPFCALQPK